MHMIEEDSCTLHRVSTTLGNLLKFEIPSGNTGNLLEFNCCSWKLFIL